jgi:hypothetical protein
MGWSSAVVCAMAGLLDSIRPMRYLHKDVVNIRKFVESKQLKIRACTYEGHLTSDKPELDPISEMLRATDKLWGRRLSYFLDVSSSTDQAVLPLKEAVLRVEAAVVSDDFLLVGYQDGGIISISGKILPFQTDAKVAEWWRP